MTNGTLGTGRQPVGDHVVPRGGGFCADEVDVLDERDGLERVRQARRAGRRRSSRRARPARTRSPCRRGRSCRRHRPATRAPSQSWAPTVMSGPSPVGTWAMKSLRRSSKFFCTRVTVAPVSSSKAAAAAVSAGFAFGVGPDDELGAALVAAVGVVGSFRRCSRPGRVRLPPRLRRIQSACAWSSFQMCRDGASLTRSRRCDGCVAGVCRRCDAWSWGMVKGAWGCRGPRSADLTRDASATTPLVSGCADDGDAAAGDVQSRGDFGPVSSSVPRASRSSGARRGG